MNDEPIHDDKLAAALGAIRDGTATFEQVLHVVDASVDAADPIAPTEAIDAVGARFMIDQDVNNGGMDQVAWNHGPQRTRLYGEQFCAVGAVENGELLLRLADALDAEDVDPDADAVAQFLQFRQAVGGPFFGIPEPDAELAEALHEWALEHPDRFG